MPFVAIPDGWQVALEGESNGLLRIWVMTFGVKDSSTHDAARANLIATGFINWFDNALKHQMDDSNSLIRVRVTDQESISGVSIVTAAGLPIAGTVGGNPSGGQVAAITTLNTGARGRANRGRSFMPGISSNYINAGDGTSLDSDAAASILAAYLTLPTEIDSAASGADLAVLSRSQGLALPVTDMTTRRYLGTQRRRVKG